MSTASAEPPLPARVYAPDSPLRSLRTFLAEAWADLAKCRELAWLLTLRDIKAQFRQSMLGYVWAFLPPVITSLTFIFLSETGTIQVGETAIPYPAFVLIGSLIWQMFADAVQSPLRAVTAGQNMLIKINFPRESLILSGVGMALFNSLVRLVILVPVLVYYQVSPSLSWLWAGVGCMGLIAMGTCISTLLTPLGVLFSDVARGIMLIMTFWMFLSAAIFPLPTEGLKAQLMHLNPIMPLVVTTRSALLGMDLPLLPYMLVVIAVSVALLLVGWLLYRVALPHMIARLGM
ncbi:MAG: ABC transporter permease [Verrucomicrobiota bacterium JB022]|nr:ABC transporter permease [Verrucomicrobiota bacterium JB022]